MNSFICKSILLVDRVCKRIGAEKLYVATIFLGVYLASYAFDNTSYGAFLASKNYYALESIYTFIVIILLPLKMGRLSLLIMCLEFVTIATHGLGYWIDLQYNQVGLYWWMIFTIFWIEVAAIISSRMVDGIYRGISELSFLCGNSSLSHKYHSSSKERVK